MSIAINTIECETVPDQEWAAYKAKFNKVYSGEDDVTHRNTYACTKQVIQKHNLRHSQGHESYTMGINHFTDLVSMYWITYNTETT